MAFNPYSSHSQYALERAASSRHLVRSSTGLRAVLDASRKGKCARLLGEAGFVGGSTFLLAIEICLRRTERKDSILRMKELAQVKLHLKVAALCCLAVSNGIPMFAQAPAADTYKSQCAPCHGDDGSGNTPVGKMLKAASFKNPTIVKTPDPALIKIIKGGKDKMPSFAGKLTDDQIKGVLAYVRVLQK